jgi:hypothetical protein
MSKNKKLIFILFFLIVNGFDGLSAGDLRYDPFKQDKRIVNGLPVYDSNPFKINQIY